MRSRSHHEPPTIGAHSAATPGYDRGVSTLEERIREVCENRDFNEAEWLARAGKSHALFSSFRVRLGKSPKATIGADHLDDLARVAGVHFEWLWKGKGPRDKEGAAPYDPRSSARLQSRVAESAVGYERSGFTVLLRVEPGRIPELRLGCLDDWPRLLASARAERRDLGDDVWRRVAETPLFLPEPPSVEMLVFVAEHIARRKAPGE